MDAGTNDAAMAADAVLSDAPLFFDTGTDAFWQPQPVDLQMSFGFEVGDWMNGYADDVTGVNLFHLANGTVVDGQLHGHALNTDNRSGIYEAGGYADSSDELRARFTRSVTLEAWVNQTSADANDVAMEFGFVAVYVLPDATVCQIDVASEDGTNIDVRSVTVPASSHEFPRGVWTHVACTYNDGDVYLYINGHLYPGTPNNPYRYVAGRNVRSVNSPYALRVAGGENYIGLLDEIKLWSRALSGSEICNQVGGDYTEGGCIPPGGI